MSTPFPRMAVIGTGLIGGSIALRARSCGLVSTIVGVDSDPAALEQAVSLGIVDEPHADVASAVAEADLVIVSVPPAKIPAVLCALRPALPAAAIVMDTGSTKATIVRQATEILGETARFIGAHPIAGTERSGPGAAFAQLFAGAKCILTPSDVTPSAVIDAGTEVWQALGAEVRLMSAEQHDLVLAAVSHLPHMVAYALVNVIADLAQEMPEIIGLSGGGFKDTTRIASSHPEMWRDICFENKDAVLRTLETFEHHLQQLKAMIINNQADDVYREFANSRRNRARILEVPYDE